LVLHVITCGIIKEEAVVPSEATKYPHYDWIIGNHSDELTPWLPLMAARCDLLKDCVTIGICF